MIDKLVELRLAGEEDLNFIRHSWLRSLHSYGHGIRDVTSSTFFKGHSKLVNKCLDRAFCLVATPNGMDNIIVGYIVWEPGEDTTLLHYIYTKSDYRNMGLANYLIDTVKGDKKIIATARGQRFREFNYNPYLLNEGIDDEESNHEESGTETISSSGKPST